jgi:hypothetical protein
MIKVINKKKYFSLDSLSKEKTPLFLEHNDFDELGGSIGNILFYMQWLNIHYPDGCYIADYANFEDVNNYKF